MDLKKLTKDELIQMVEDRKHLVSVVKKKDEEIAELKRKHKDDLEAAIKRSELKHEDLVKEQGEYAERLKKYVEQQGHAINEVMFQYGALLKTLQGTIDAHIYINDKISKILKEE